jgi:acetolactate decarboxylase
MAKNLIYQTGTINSLLQGVYLGNKTIKQVMKYGDFGLGTYDNVNGELIACDGVCYRANGEGHLEVADPHSFTPFGVVTKFVSQHREELGKFDFHSLEQHLLDLFPSRNLVYALRISGKFKQINLRSEECFRNIEGQKLADVLPKMQNMFDLQNIEGTLVGVWYPEYMSRVNVAGFHFHFVDTGRQHGGHVFGFDMEHGILDIQALHDVQINLIESTTFEQADLAGHLADEVKAVEKIRT